MSRNDLKLVPLLVVVLVLGLRLLLQEVSRVDERANGFVVYYTSARLLTEHADPARFYDESWFQTQVARFEPTVRDVFWANPPNMSLLLLPLSRFSYRTARTAWLVLGFALLTAVGLVLASQLHSAAWGAAFVAFAYLCAPVRDNLFHGQFYVLAFALLTVAFFGYRKQRDAQLGVPLAVLLTLKTAAPLMGLLLVVQRRWRALAIGLGCAVAVSLAALPWIGTDAWALYARELSEVTSRPALAVTAYQTLFSFFHHLFGPGGSGVGAPLLRAPTLAVILTALSAATLLALTCWVAYHRGHNDRNFAAFVIVSLVATPVTSEAHWVMALLPVGILLADVPPRGRGYILLLLAGALMLGMSLPYTSARLTNGWFALLAYPRLYGGLLLWGLALWPVRSARRFSVPDGAPGSQGRVMQRAV